MTNEDIVRELIVKDLGWTGNVKDLTPDYDLIENDVVDSLGIMKLVALIEERFGTEVPDEQLVPENFASIRAMSNMIEPLAAG